MLPLTVATINLRNRADRWLQRRRLLVAELIETAPDLISLQEISLSIGQGSWLAKQVNVRMTGKSSGPYRIVQARRTEAAHWGEAVGVMTKLPVLYHDSLALSYGRVALRVNVELPAERTDGRFGSLDFVAVHLHHEDRGDDVRLEQVMQLTGWLNDRRRVPLQVIAGDFNELPGGPAIRFLKQSYRSAYAEVVGREPLATFPTCLPQPLLDWSGCLDYVFVSPAVYTIAAASLFGTKPAADDDTLYPSDHVGVLVRLEV
jgi:endonuclease/exonuclease/phosphatase family metal-dependent hydrolase